jgi:hypothetical protein
MAKLLFIQIESSAPILHFSVDEVNPDYGPPNPDPAQRQIAGLVGGNAIPESMGVALILDKSSKI